MNLPKWTFPLFTLALLTACATDSGPNPPDEADVAGNNSAVLADAPLGSGEAEVEALRKEVTVNLADKNPNFELGPFYALRKSVDTQTLYWVLPVTNVGDETRCFIKIVDAIFRDETDSVLSAEMGQFVDGSVGVLSSVYTNTCLAPDETGYIQGIQRGDNAPVYSTLETVDIARIEARSDIPTAPATQVIPQSYAVSMAGELVVSAENEGDRLGYVTDALYTLLDAEGRPLSWGFLDRSADWDGEISPGEVRRLETDIRYQGRAEKIRPVINFDNEPPSEMDAQAVGVAADVARLKRRHALEDAKLESLPLHP